MSAPADDGARRAAFFQQLQRVGASIAATDDVDDIMLNLSAGICELFGADRLSIYALGEDQSSLVSKVKTGLASFKQLKLPVSADSVAGYAALSGKMLNLLDVYDEAELLRHSPALRFQQGVDRRTGYRTREMLAAPIADAASGQLLGVIQLINNRSGGPYSPMVEEGVRTLSLTLAAAFARAGAAPRRERSRFAALIPETVLPRARLDLALHQAAATQRDIEDVLIDDFGIKTVLVGRALADFFSVPYFTFDSEHRRPVRLLDQFKHADVLRQQWMPVVDDSNGLFVLAVDPDQARADGAVALAFPGVRPVWCVTTRREFGSMAGQFFGARAARAAPSAVAQDIGQGVAQGMAPAVSTAVPADLAALVGGLALQAHLHGIRQLHIETTAGDVAGEVRFQVSGIFTAPPV
ncbi:GAF domain-containing protein [Rugamonas sp.]|uniref:GAF domain-containing protein n=1 Tax=Rugamonas sp. TaxID=1926287 RepID=UPI0025EB79EC|nr:GAF domain-containing protein [Rugamonas sp.]